MTSVSYKLQWKGPFRFCGNGDGSLLLNEDALSAGVYIWTILMNEKHWAYYVGETGKSFSQRHIDHLRSYYSGEYRIYESTEFIKGRKLLVWAGAFGQKNRHKLSEFRAREKFFLKKVQEIVSLINVFVIPGVDNRRLRQRVEAALTQELTRQPGPAGEFQDDDIRYKPTRFDESPILCTLETPLPIVGLSDRAHTKLEFKQ